MGNTTTFTDLIAEPISKKIFLCEINVAEKLNKTGWESILVIQPPINSILADKITLNGNMFLPNQNSVNSILTNNVTLGGNILLTVQNSVNSILADNITLL